jgi:hypothetical protein
MIVYPTRWRRARLAAVCCAALAALTLAAADITAADAGTATTAWGSGGAIVITDDGAVLGMTAGTVDEFLGIPYAAPPTGHLRWRPPQSPARWHRRPQICRRTTSYCHPCRHQRRPPLTITSQPIHSAGGSR